MYAWEILYEAGFGKGGGWSDPRTQSTVQQIAGVELSLGH